MEMIYTEGEPAQELVQRQFVDAMKQAARC